MSEPGAARLEIGMAATLEREIPPEWALTHYDPNLPPVFSTPAMIGMMEMATVKAIHGALAPGQITVGTRIEVDHLKPAPVGAKVVASAKLAEINGRFLVFDVEARDGVVLLGKGRVFRAIVKHARFSEKAAANAHR